MSTFHLAVITDLTLPDWIGGGTLVNDYVAQCARAQGVQVSYIRINPAVDEWKDFDHANVDAYFVANIPHMPVSYMLELVNSKKRYVMFRHDIASLCYTESPDAQPAARLLRFLFDNAVANFFISPLQLAYYQKVCPVPRAYCVPPPLDLGAFLDGNRAERKGHLYLGEIAAARGIEESLAAMVAQSDGTPMSFYGQAVEPPLAAQVRSAGAQIHEAIPHSEVPALLNQYQHFYYHPRIVDAFCLKVLEAELCGMQLHVNRNNIGRYFYSDPAPAIADFMKNTSAQMIVQKILGAN